MNVIQSWSLSYGNFLATILTSDSVTAVGWLHQCFPLGQCQLAVPGVVGTNFGLLYQGRLDKREFWYLWL